MAVVLVQLLVQQAVQVVAEQVVLVVQEEQEILPQLVHLKEMQVVLDIQLEI